jgi:hypothetical protein
MAIVYLQLEPCLFVLIFHPSHVSVSWSLVGHSHPKPLHRSVCLAALEARNLIEPCSTWC